MPRIIGLRAALLAAVFACFFYGRAGSMELDDLLRRPCGADADCLVARIGCGCLAVRADSADELKRLMPADFFDCSAGADSKCSHFPVCSERRMCVLSRKPLPARGKRVRRLAAARQALRDGLPRLKTCAVSADCVVVAYDCGCETINGRSENRLAALEGAVRSAQPERIWACRGEEDQRCRMTPACVSGSCAFPAAGQR